MTSVPRKLAKVAISFSSDSDWVAGIETAVVVAEPSNSKKQHPLPFFYINVKASGKSFSQTDSTDLSVRNLKKRTMSLLAKLCLYTFLFYFPRALKLQKCHGCRLKAEWMD